MSSRPVWLDVLVLSLAAVVLTWQPFFLQGRLNLFELGLYLPGIDGILHGQVPFRDFFYLRGPFELYVPALLMHLGGEQVWLLAAYFYVGSVLTLIAAIMIGRELYPNRSFLYIMAVVLIARTFPRVVFTYWGGLRYVWGLLAVWCAIRFLKTDKSRWIAAAGVLVGVSLLTSIEIGISAGTAVLMALGLGVGLVRTPVGKAVAAAAGGCTAVVVPYIFYLAAQGALLPFADNVWTVVTRMTSIYVVQKTPQGLVEFLIAMVNPKHPWFHLLTVLWGYIVLGGYVWFKYTRRSLDRIDAGVIALAGYGLVLYLTSFRNLWASQFEMALQPWKIIQFFLLAQAFVWIKNSGIARRRFLSGFVLAAVVASSLAFSIAHFQKRFFVFKFLTRKFSGKSIEAIEPLGAQAKQRLDLPRARNLVVPGDQAQDLTGLAAFLNAHTRGNEPVLMYPEMAAVHFIVDRPYLGRFAHATMAWLSDAWYKQWFSDVQKTAPKYAVVPKKLPDYFDSCYLIVPANRQKFEQTMQFIKTNYKPISQTASWLIYQRTTP